MSTIKALIAMPAIFFGHGSPMNAIESNKYTKSWIEISKSFPKPKAIISISAHWETLGDKNNETKITSNKNQKTIHDFYGFPKELYDIKYNAKGDTALAEKIQKLTVDSALDDSWGLDHGTWSILKHIYPKADIPVVQISIDKKKTPKEHYEFAKKLKDLRKEGVLIIGSGNIVHNLTAIKWNGGDPYPWASEFSSQIKSAIINNDIDKILNYKNIKGSKESVPSAEHFIPLIYILALKDEKDSISFFAEGFEMGSLSMDSFVVGG